MYIGSTNFSPIRISYNKWHNHLTSSPYLSKVINSNYIVDRAITVSLEDFDDIIAPTRANTYLLVDFESFTSYIQFASLYPSNIDGYIV